MTLTSVLILKKVSLDKLLSQGVGDIQLVSICKTLYFKIVMIAIRRCLKISLRSRTCGTQKISKNNAAEVQS